MNKTVPVALTLASLLTLSGCAGTTSDFECNATTSDTCMTIEQAIEAEAQSQAICMQTEDFRRAYEAFAAKQKPEFQGDY